ncbi:hypothetical protein V5P93_001762 [Actinokineospora auranticolor]|uniref:Uncharacterized protein n=1 Tax=Actinokineospora auranticolor TaxID=155976 RepID=A0A2S6GGV0_9PSEU|nr:hypothetical protein [Actinokineospora auranticolor]PPK64366.1 hypothetical protein CLV40_12089 [Actinokineospora auranticolor]
MTPLLLALAPTLIALALRVPGRHPTGTGSAAPRGYRGLLADLDRRIDLEAGLADATLATHGTNLTAALTDTLDIDA